MTVTRTAAALALKITLLGRRVCFYVHSFLDDGLLKLVMDYFVRTHT